jgi:hypothetical protein
MTSSETAQKSVVAEPRPKVCEAQQTRAYTNSSAGPGESDDSDTSTEPELGFAAPIGRVERFLLDSVKIRSEVLCVVCHTKHTFLSILAWK